MNNCETDISFRAQPVSRVCLVDLVVDLGVSSVESFAPLGQRSDASGSTEESNAEKQPTGVALPR
jgi:hypothetical protein